MPNIRLVASSPPMMLIDGSNAAPIDVDCCCDTCPDIPIFISLQPGGTFCDVCEGGVELDWSMGVFVNTEGDCEVHASGGFDFPPSIFECLIDGDPTDCTNATWTLDFVLDTGSNTFDISATITLPACGDCCSFTYTVTRTGVTYTGSSQDLGEDMGTNCDSPLGRFALFVNGP